MTLERQRGEPVGFNNLPVVEFTPDIFQTACDKYLEIKAIVAKGDRLTKHQRMYAVLSRPDVVGRIVSSRDVYDACGLVLIKHRANMNATKKGLDDKLCQDGLRVYSVPGYGYVLLPQINHSGLVRIPSLSPVEKPVALPREWAEP